MTFLFLIFHNVLAIYNVLLRNANTAARLTYLRRHCLGISARDFDPSVKACAIVGLNDGSSVHIAGPDSTVVAACK